MTAEEPPALAYLEKTLADAYRKEIDQEENIWRSLPFFAAALALQLAALFPLIDKLPVPDTPLGRLSVVLLGLVAAATLISLGFLAASIFPQRFDYVAREPSLFAYAHQLMDRERLAGLENGEQVMSALVTLKTEIARQYALATDHNRRINKRRERFRSVAGLAALCSVLTTVFLVGATYAHYLSVRGAHRDDITRSSAVTDPRNGEGAHP